MSRRVVIGILIVLIVSVLGGIVALVVSRLQDNASDTTQNPQTSSLPTGERGGQQVVDPTGDLDADGLINADETLWGTNPNLRDTDGDGFTDGQEVTANHNPTVPSPNDKLPDGFVPGKNIAPLPGSAPSQTSFESYFSDNVDLTGGKTNLTQEYGRKVSDKDKSSVTFAEFISSQPIVITLPKANESTIAKVAESSLALSQYLSVAGDISTISDKTRVSLALTNLLQNKNGSGFTTLSERVGSFQKNLLTSSVPPSALQYHKLLLGYSELLKATSAIIGSYDTDPVKSLVTLRQLDAIDRQYYPLILQERARLITLSQ